MMRVSVAITRDDGTEISAAVEASGQYAPDVMNDIANRANAALKEAHALEWSGTETEGQ